MAPKKCMKILIYATQANNFSLMWNKGRHKIQKVMLKKYDEHDSVQKKQMFFKRVIKIWYAMRFLCYAMVYVLKDKLSATVHVYII